MKKEIEVEVCGTAGTTNIYQEQGTHATIYLEYGISDVKINGNDFRTYDL